VATGPFQEATFAPGSFECVTMWDYIEHSLDPAGDLAKAYELLAPGGVLALSTGDAASLVARVSGRRWHLLTPHHHNFFFSSAVARTALQGAGFGVVSLRHPANRFTLRYLIHKLATIAPRGAIFTHAGEWLGKRRVGSVALPLNLFDVMEVFARKESTTRAEH
jgi:2-polyprenyl-3-methyl-5-hydroxy-6-metoxy-1,4-benzoquinol methylase